MPTDPAESTAPAAVIPLHVVDVPGLAAWLEARAPHERAWIEALGFGAKIGDVAAIPGADGSCVAAVAGWGTAEGRRRDRFHLAAAAERLPPGRYALAPDLPADLDPALETLGWHLAGYRFSRYRGAAPLAADLMTPDGVDSARVSAVAVAAALMQDLINTPARDLGPEALEAAAVALAASHRGATRIIRGAAALRAENLPLIAAVGAAAAEVPRLVELRWDRRGARQVTLVGKGVCFDTGGLNIKPAGGMALMKKDMGGAATALGLAQMIVEARLDVSLRVLLPIVENAISGPAMRPGDILTSRKGLTVEVNNTDAEGRLILADALALADEEDPDMVVSLATLTGAARVALGPDLPALFTDDDALAAELAAAATAVADPLWRLPFWDPYEPLIEPGIADLDNAPGGGMAGAITAALFLRRFVERAGAYAHVDLYGWTPTAKPGRPKGGACQAARAILAFLEARCPPTS